MLRVSVCFLFALIYVVHKLETLKLVTKIKWNESSKDIYCRNTKDSTVEAGTRSILLFKQFCFWRTASKDWNIMPLFSKFAFWSFKWDRRTSLFSYQTFESLLRLPTNLYFLGPQMAVWIIRAYLVNTRQADWNSLTSPPRRHSTLSRKTSGPTLLPRYVSQSTLEEENWRPLNQTPERQPGFKLPSP